MANGSREVHIPVFGHVSSRPAGDRKAEWQLVAETPGAFTPRPGEVYRFEFMGIPHVRDPDLVQVVDALAGAQARAVTAVTLAGAPVTARAVRRLADLPWLDALDAFRMTDEGLGAVAKLTELRRLHLDTSDVTDRGLAQLRTLTKLEDLSVHACPITDAGAEHVARLPALAELSVAGCHALTDRAVRALAAAPALHVINVLGCWRLTDRALADLAGMPKLTYLSLGRGGGFWLRVLRTFGVPGDPEVGSFSPRGVQRLLDAHPDCTFWQPIDWAALSG